MGHLRLKRIYEAPAREDGHRVLVERLWPRGVSKDKAALDEWPKDIAPSDALRRWYAHDPARWAEFRRRYAAELADKDDLLSSLRARLARRNVTLLFAARDEARNSAVVLKSVLDKPARTTPPRRRRTAS